MINLPALEAGLAPLVKLEPEPIQWDVGVRFAVACGVPPMIGAATGHPRAGVFAAFCGTVIAYPRALRNSAPGLDASKPGTST